MTQRERRLAIMLGGIVVLGGIFLAYQLVLRPLREYSESISALEQDTETAEAQLAKIRKEKANLDKWRLMSLPVDRARPTDPSLANREYNAYLSDLMRKHKFGIESFTAARNFARARWLRQP